MYQIPIQENSNKRRANFDPNKRPTKKGGNSNVMTIDKEDQQQQQQPKPPQPITTGLPQKPKKAGPRQLTQKEQRERAQFDAPVAVTQGQRIPQGQSIIPRIETNVPIIPAPENPPKQTINTDTTYADQLARIAATNEENARRRQAEENARRKEAEENQRIRREANEALEREALALIEKSKEKQREERERILNQQAQRDALRLQFNNQNLINNQRRRTMGFEVPETPPPNEETPIEPIRSMRRPDRIDVPNPPRYDLSKMSPQQIAQLEQQKLDEALGTPEITINTQPNIIQSGIQIAGDVVQAVRNLVVPNETQTNRSEEVPIQIDIDELPIETEETNAAGTQSMLSKDELPDFWY